MKLKEIPKSTKSYEVRVTTLLVVPPGKSIYDEIATAISIDDITMCQGEYNGVVCSKREKCYRYMARPTEHWQSFFADFTPNETCEYFWPIKNMEADQ